MEREEARMKQEEDDKQMAMALAQEEEEYSSSSEEEVKRPPPKKPVRQVARRRELDRRDHAIDNHQLNFEMKGFNKDMFRRLITKTYEDYYPAEFSRKHWNVDDFMQIVVDLAME
jgi:hypothetical protein